MPSRRRFLNAAALSACGLMVSSPSALSLAASANATGGSMATRPIPRTNEQLPVIGMGSSGSFEVGDSAADRDPLRDVLKRFFAGGGTLIDTAPSYGRAEAVIGDLLAEGGWRDKTFLATKLGATGREAGQAQFAESLRQLKTDKVELLQVHNLVDWKTQLALIDNLKKQGKTRYSGITHYTESGQDALAEAVQATKPDFLQINYSVISRGAEKRLFPMAQELGVAVLINRAFDDGRLFSQVKGRALPPWAAEAGITSWAQAFLKFALSHPAVTAVIPATGKPDRQSDNLLAGLGPTLTAAQRQSLTDMFA